MESACQTSDARDVPKNHSVFLSGHSVLAETDRQTLTATESTGKHYVMIHTVSTSAYLRECLAHQIIRQEHLVRWHQGYLVFENESAEPADQFQAMVLHRNNQLGQQAMETATHTW